MVGAAMTPPAPGSLSSPNMGIMQQQQQQQIASLVNSYRLSTVADRMAAHILPTGRESNANEFFNLCLSLARGIDFAVAHNEVPARAHELPILLTQICQRRNDLFLQSAIMVLMLSVKNACKAGWFSDKENQELIALANEMGSSFSGHRNLNTGPSNLVTTISTIMTRFYPQMKMGQILVSLEIEPGYGAFMIDFQLSKNVRHSPQEKIQLFVAQTDNIETSACIISPQEANFLLNGKPVDRRTNALMDPGPQLPTTVNKLLKFGTNLLQAVGLFNGHYVAVVAFMSMEPSLNSPVIQDYVQSGIAVQDSDSDIIEGPSRISLNCPISYKRIRTPVKGHSCKHLQCFDFENFVDINSRRPSWRCPHCNQHVCYTDIRVDQNMVKVLREVGKDVADVIICADGSWKAVMESDDNMDVAHDKIEKGLEQQESTGLSNSGLVVLDLTKDDDELDALSTDETEDQKPILTNLQSQPVAANITRSSESNDTVGVNQNVLSQTEDDFWSGLLYSNGSASSSSRMDAQFVGGISEPTSNFMTSSVLADAMTDAFSHALNREAEARGYTNLTTSVTQSQYSAPNNLLLQQLQLANNQEYGRLPLNRHVSRTPIAVQALPAPSPTPSPQQRSVTSLGFMTPNGSSLPPQAAVSVANSYSDVERQQQFSRPHMNAFLGPDIASASLQHHLAAQVVGLPPTSTLPGAYRVSSGLSTENQNIYQQQALNLRMPQSRNQPSVVIPPSSSPLARTPTQQGSAPVGVGHTAGNVSSQHARGMVASHRATRTATQITRQPPTVPVQVQASRTGPPYQANAEGVRASAGEQRVNMAGQPQGVSPDNFTDLPSEHNWRPGRMRGSLTGRAYSAALSQLMIQPTQPTQAGRPLTNPISSLPTVPPHLQVPLANRRNAHLPQAQNNPITERGSVNGGSGILPERSSGMN